MSSDFAAILMGIVALAVFLGYHIRRHRRRKQEIRQLRDAFSIRPEENK